MKYFRFGPLLNLILIEVVLSLCIAFLVTFASLPRDTSRFPGGRKNSRAQAELFVTTVLGALTVIQAYENGALNCEGEVSSGLILSIGGTLPGCIEFLFRDPERRRGWGYMATVISFYCTIFGLINTGLNARQAGWTESNVTSIISDALSPSTTGFNKIPKPSV